MSLDCELPEFYSHAERTARKAYKCCECAAEIEPGERYFLVTGKWNGSIQRYHQHLLCEKACEFIRDQFEDDCLSYGGLWEWYCDVKDWLNNRQQKKREKVQKIRLMMAKILRRERE